MQLWVGNSCESRRRLHPGRAANDASLLITKTIGYTGKSFVRNLARGVCDQDNLRSCLRRGRWSRLKVAVPGAGEAKLPLYDKRANLCVLAEGRQTLRLLSPSGCNHS